MNVDETTSRHSAILDRRTTIATAVTLVIANVVFAVIQRMRNDGLGWVLYLSHGAVAASVAVALWRHRPDARWNLAGFLALVLPMLPMFWLEQTRAVAAGALWQPFVGRKLILLGLAFLTPYSEGTALALLSIFTIESMALWLHLGLHKNPVVLAAGEPWVTILFFGSGFALVFLRWRSRALEAQLRRSEAETEALRQLRQLSVAVSDRVNTPLQTLELGLCVLEKRHPTDRSVLERMHRSLQVLFELSASLYSLNVDRLRAARDRGVRLERGPA